MGNVVGDKNNKYGTDAFSLAIWIVVWLKLTVAEKSRTWIS